MPSAKYKLFNQADCGGSKRVNILDILNDIKRNQPITQQELIKVNAYLKQRNHPLIDESVVHIKPTFNVPVKLNQKSMVEQPKGE